MFPFGVLYRDRSINSIVVCPGGTLADAKLVLETAAMFTADSGSAHNANSPLAFVNVTAAGQSLSGSGSKSTHAPATGCFPVLVIVTTTPAMVRNPGAERSIVPSSAANETSCTLTGPVSVIAA